MSKLYKHAETIRNHPNEEARSRGNRCQCAAAPLLVGPPTSMQSASKVYRASGVNRRSCPKARSRLPSPHRFNGIPLLFACASRREAAGLFLIRVHPARDDVHVHVRHRLPRIPAVLHAHLARVGAVHLLDGRLDSPYGHPQIISLGLSQVTRARHETTGRDKHVPRHERPKVDKGHGFPPFALSEYVPLVDGEAAEGVVVIRRAPSHNRPVRARLHRHHLKGTVLAVGVVGDVHRNHLGPGELVFEAGCPALDRAEDLVVWKKVVRNPRHDVHMQVRDRSAAADPVLQEKISCDSSSS
mmetsp:Transcript_15355/g.50117  ORF Transcript_15355/g.50117 Transcript_15355/m.50117 type:complete len:299 (+) Transcript_15355:319-1215(+)